MSKLSLSSITGGYGATSTINANFQAIVDFLDSVVSRDGVSPNYMASDLDMNSHRIINLQDAENGGEPVTKRQLDAYATTSLASFNASAGTYTASGTGAVSRTMSAKLGEWVSPEDFGAVGDGTANDTTALTNALATGKRVLLTPGRTYLFNSNLSITTNYQWLMGGGVLKPSGNCGVVVTGGCLGAVVDVVVDSAAHTGVAVKVDTAHRARIRLYAKDVLNGVYVTGANHTTIEWMYGACRGYGITWYGTTVVRSDILNIGEAVFSVGAGQYGLDWDGNCHSLTAQKLGIVCGASVSAANGYGVIVRNTSGGTVPAIGKFKHVEIDYCGTHAIDITTGSDYDIATPYVLGATGSGIRVGATINSYEVRVLGGKSRGNTRYGIEALGGVVLFGGATDLSSNTLGETTGNVWCKTPRVALDSNAYFGLSGTDPLLVWDANDYTAYTRSTNTKTDFINSVAVWAMDATRLTAGVRVRLPTSTVAALPAVHLAGDTYFATNGRKNGEGAGAGTGVLVFSDGTAWRAVDTGATVAA
jgi:hypothetical protein